MQGARLEQPRLEVTVDHDVVTVAFEAVLVVDHHVLDGFERVHLHQVVRVRVRVRVRLGVRVRVRVRVRVSKQSAVSSQQ